MGAQANTDVGGWVGGWVGGSGGTGAQAKADIPFQRFEPLVELHAQGHQVLLGNVGLNHHPATAAAAQASASARTPPSHFLRLLGEKAADLLAQTRQGLHALGPQGQQRVVEAAACVGTDATPAAAVGAAAAQAAEEGGGRGGRWWGPRRGFQGGAGGMGAFGRGGRGQRGEEGQGVGRGRGDGLPLGVTHVWE